MRALMSEALKGQAIFLGQNDSDAALEIAHSSRSETVGTRIDAGLGKAAWITAVAAVAAVAGRKLFEKC